jgi:hypothetical protein
MLTPFYSLGVSLSAPKSSRDVYYKMYACVRNPIISAAVPLLALYHGFICNEKRER